MGKILEFIKEDSGMKLEIIREKNLDRQMELEQKEEREEQDRQEWLRNLKAGDEVAMNFGKVAYSNYAISTVREIKRSGRIVIENGRSFHPDGKEVRNPDWNLIVKLEPVTDQIIEHIERRNLISKINGFKFMECSTDELRAVYNVIKEKAEGTYIPF